MSTDFALFGRRRHLLPVEPLHWTPLPGNALAHIQKSHEIDIDDIYESMRRYAREHPGCSDAEYYSSGSAKTVAVGYLCEGIRLALMPEPSGEIDVDRWIDEEQARQAAAEDSYRRSKELRDWGDVR